MVTQNSLNKTIKDNGVLDGCIIGGTTAAAATFTTSTSKTVACTIQTLTDAASIAWDASLGAYATVTLADNRALANPSNVVAGGLYKIIIKQDGTGGRTLSFGANYKFPGAVAPTISTGISAVDIIEFIAESTSVLHCVNCIYDSK